MTITKFCGRHLDCKIFLSGYVDFTSIDLDKKKCRPMLNNIWKCFFIDKALNRFKVAREKYHISSWEQTFKKWYLFFDQIQRVRLQYAYCCHTGDSTWNRKAFVSKWNHSLLYISIVLPLILCLCFCFISRKSFRGLLMHLLINHTGKVTLEIFYF